MNDITFTEVFLCDVTGLGYSYITGDRLLCQGFNSTMDATHVDLAATWKRKMWSNTLSTEENLRPFSVPYGVCFGESRVGSVCVSVCGWGHAVPLGHVQDFLCLPASHI